MLIEKILIELENLILDASRIPLTNKRIIEENDLADLIDNIRENLPKEIAEAKRILNDKNYILENAQIEAKNIISQAQSYVNKLTDKNLISQQAQEKAQEIIEKTHEKANDIQNHALNYANDVFKYLEDILDKTLNIIRQEKQNIMNKQHLKQ